MLYVNPCMSWGGKKRIGSILPGIEKVEKWKRIPATQGLRHSESEGIECMKNSKKINKATFQ